MHIKLLSDNRIFEFSHKLIHIIQFLIVFIVDTDKNLTAFTCKFLNITFLFEKFGIYNLILEYLSVKLGIWYLYIHCCLLGVSCWKLSCRFLFDCVPIRVLLVSVSLEKMDVDEKIETLTNMVQQ